MKLRYDTQVPWPHLIVATLLITGSSSYCGELEQPSASSSSSNSASSSANSVSSSHDYLSMSHSLNQGREELEAHNRRIYNVIPDFEKLILPSSPSSSSALALSPSPALAPLTDDGYTQLITTFQFNEERCNQHKDQVKLMLKKLTARHIAEINGNDDRRQQYRMWLIQQPQQSGICILNNCNNCGNHQ